MKYHQLVPARAVNALSDWLVFNLEELGVEAPLVYSRLLLSLLHTTFHVNSIEQAADIPYFKEFLTLNKHYQVSQLDTEELKRFAAVNILVEATTSTNSAREQDNSTIVDLVNELYKRIREIEKESSSATGAAAAAAESLTDPRLGPFQRRIGTLAAFDDAKQAPLVGATLEDHAKKYYSAFPALSTEEIGRVVALPLDQQQQLEKESAAIARRKSEEKRERKFSTPPGLLSWSNVLNTTTTTATTKTSASGTKTNNKNCVAAMNIGKCTTTSASSSSGINSLKRKPKRKRPGKAKSFYIKKQSASVDSSGACDALWDMNFEGNWEMGHDMISDFANKTYKRNRSVSEGEVYTNKMSSSALQSRLKDLPAGGTMEPPKHENNNCEDVVDFYNSSTPLTSFLPAQLITETSQDSLFYGETTMDCSKMQQSTDVSRMKAKFESIKSLWDTEVDLIDTGGNVWEPLERISAPYPEFGSSRYQPEEVAKSFLENNFDFIRNGMNLHSSIWSNEGSSSVADDNWPTAAAEDAASFSDARKCREICESYKRESQEPYVPALTSLAPPLPVPSEKRASLVTLINHSEHSVFAEVVPPTGSSRAGTQSLQRYSQMTTSSFNEDPSDPTENLLTSEKTHFTPIKRSSYPDGYTFDINGSLDEVDFYRSESGSLYLESEKYLEFRETEEPLEEVIPRPREEERFSIKFCVQVQNEKCCQTDDADFDAGSEVDFGWSAAESFEFGSGWRYNERILQDTRIDFAADGSDDDSSKLMGSWSTGTGHECPNGNNNNIHRVWEACATCNDSQSFPANRRLKDELHADGEEILSDLNYFQSLIIGNDWDDEGVGGGGGGGGDSEETLDCIIDRSKVYHKVDKFVSDLLKPETTQTLAKALDNTADWETVAENDLLPFAYLFNCGREKKANLCDDEKAKLKERQLEVKAPVPPDISSIDFLRLFNYIDAGLWNTTTMLRSSRLERKRRHSACRNYFNGTIRMKGFIGDGFGLDEKHHLDPPIILNPDLGTDLNFIALNSKYWATDASFIFKNNNLLLKQIEITRPLTR